MARSPYEIRLAPPAARLLKKLPPEVRDRISLGLREQAQRAGTAAGGGRGGKRVKTVRGRADRFFRLRVGDYRVMYDLLDDDRTLLVLGVVHRRDLERWLRSR